MEISSPPGNVIGSIQQDWTIVTPKFNIQDETGETVLTVKGPAIPVTFGGDLTFQVYNCSFLPINKVLNVNTSFNIL